METVEKYAVLVQSRFFDFFKILKTLKSRNRFWVPECNLRFLQKLFDRLDHRVFVFEFQARAAEQKIEFKFLIVIIMIDHRNLFPFVIS